MRICVVSDVHYKYHIQTEDERATNAAFTEFLDDIRGQYDILVLNGDIFDLWFDWKYSVIKQYLPVLKRLSLIRDNGCRIVYISGNHDFWFGDYFPEYLDAELVPDSYELEADGKKILITHGDKYTVNDLRYKMFRSVIRQPWLKNVFSILHPDLALWVGTKLSRSSRKRKGSPLIREKKISGLQSYAFGKIQKGFHYVIMGHSHKPCQSPHKNGLYVNCGDWIVHRTFVEIIDGKIELCSFEPSSENKEL